MARHSSLTNAVNAARRTPTGAPPEPDAVAASDTFLRRPLTTSRRNASVSWSGLGDNMCIAPSLRSVRHLRPGWRTKTELAPWPPPLHASAGLRPERLALCVRRISRAADGDDATM
jgi:hypothetical protein